MSSISYGVIFDVDGVLVDSYQAHFITWQASARKHGFDCTEAEFALAFGRTAREVIRESWDSSLSDQWIKDFEDEKESLYREMISKEFPAIPGAFELIHALHDDQIAMAIGSSGPPLNVRAVVQALKAEDAITTVITGADVKAGKPNPDVFLQGSKGMQVPPERCVVLEDAVPGLQAARAAGMKCVGVVSSGRSREELADADHLVTDLTQLSPELIKQVIDG
ncbi:MAG: HAD family phosphatase [Fuerstiella sp.]